jgi:hypothetical protein
MISFFDSPAIIAVCGRALQPAEGLLPHLRETLIFSAF